MRKFVITGVSLVALAVPSAALAGAPSGTIDGIVYNPNAKPTTANVASPTPRSLVGVSDGSSPWTSARTSARPPQSQA